LEACIFPSFAWICETWEKDGKNGDEAGNDINTGKKVINAGIQCFLTDCRKKLSNKFLKKIWVQVLLISPSLE